MIGNLIAQIPANLPVQGVGNVPTTGVQGFDKVISIAVKLAVVIAVFLVVKGGAEILLSGGDANKVKAGKDQVTSALLGLTLVLLAVVFVKVVHSVVISNM